jgi:lysophospholipase L1-like esterase
VQRPTKAWPAIAARRADVAVVNLGVGGNDYLDPFVARAIRDTAADVISLEVGVNIVMQATFTRRTFGPALDGFLDTIREGHAETPLIVMSPIVCPLLEAATGPLGIDDAGNLTARQVDEDEGWPLLSLERVRQLIEAVVVRRSRSDPNLAYVDGLQLFGADGAADLADGIHPTSEGYERLGRRFADTALDSMPPGR